MAIFQRIIVSEKITKNGKSIKTMGWGLKLKDYDTPIAINKLDFFELDTEDLVDATELSVGFENKDFTFNLNEIKKNKTDWEVIEEMFDPE